MAADILKEYVLGDMKARYVNDKEAGQTGLLLLPASYDGKEQEKDQKTDSLVQIKVTGDIYNEAYAMGNSMRDSETVRRLRFVEQSETEKEGKKWIKTVLRDDRGYQVSHYLVWKVSTP